MTRLRALVAGWMPAGLAGAFVALTALSQEGVAPRIALVLAGWVYGVAVLGLVRLFRVAPWGYPVAGLVSGPVPVVLVAWRSIEPDEWLPLWLVTALLGAAIGTLELARVRRAPATDSA